MGLADNAARNAGRPTSSPFGTYGLPPYAAAPKPTPAKPVGGTSTPNRFIPELATPQQRAQLSPNVRAQAPAVTKPKPTPSKSNLGTGSIETKTAPTTTTTTSEPTVAKKPLDVTLAQEDLQSVQNAADALRLFQENQAKAQLTDALAKIDRSALEQYAGIANDYAARGLARSGGKLMAEQKALDEVTRTKAEAQQAVTDFLNELKLTGNLEQAKTNLGKSGAFQSWITDNYGTPGA